MSNTGAVTETIDVDTDVDVVNVAVGTATVAIDGSGAEIIAPGGKATAAITPSVITVRTAI